MGGSVGACRTNAVANTDATAGIPWEEEGKCKGKDRDRDGDGDNNYVDNKDGFCNLPPLPTIDVRGAKSYHVHDFLGNAGFEQCLIVPCIVIVQVDRGCDGGGRQPDYDDIDNNDVKITSNA
jgi:hypothetical protein